MGRFRDWFENKLVVGGMPNVNDWNMMGVPQMKVDIVINVSDEHNWNMINFANNLNIQYFWLPLHEYSKNYNIGLSSIYGALFVLYEAEQMKKKVYLHCHAGSNRSPMIKAAYHYLRTSAHEIVEKNYDPRIEELFHNKVVNVNQFITDNNDLIKDFHGETTSIVKTRNTTVNNNRLLENIRTGMLPSQPKMESFLKECGIAFEKYITQSEDNSAPSLDQILLNSQIN